MKWIGQHIVDLIARFRSDIYLDEIKTGTIASGSNLGLDSDNKIVKAAEASGDITGVKITTDSGSGSPANVASGVAGFSLLGSNGVGVTNSGITITATAVPGEIDHDSLNNFVANEHIDWTTDQGSTNIHTGNYNNTTYSEATSDEAGLMSTAHYDKLEGIETSADVTDATNVTAAGALMDSECSSLASVKALDQGVATGDSPQFAGINLGHASDTTFARSASGVATIESNIIQTRDKVIYLEHATFSDDIGTTEHFIPFVTTSEATAFANVVTPMIMPVAGKLLGAHCKANNHWNGSSNEVTFKLYRVPDGSLWSNGNAAVLGTKVITGVARTAMHTADFTDLTTAGASGTNAFSAGDLIGVSITHSQAQGTTSKVSSTLVFELDFNSY